MSDELPGKRARAALERGLKEFGAYPADFVAHIDNIIAKQDADEESA
jgi:hypothetical protein